MVVKKPISLKKDLFDYAEDQAKRFFQDNFSAFIGYLISCHREGIEMKRTQSLENNIKKNEKTDKLIDDVEEFFK